MTYEDINIVYEDNHLLAAVKPAGVPAQADESGDTDMLTLLKEYLKVKYAKPGEAYLGLVHRLDRPTGGVMVFAKTSKAAARLTQSMKDGEFEKTYLCVTCGVPKDKSGELVHYLKKNERTNTVAIVPMLTQGAKRAELHYDVLQDKQGFALVKVRLGTQVASDPRADGVAQMSAVRRQALRRRSQNLQTRLGVVGNAHFFPSSHGGKTHDVFGLSAHG